MKLNISLELDWLDEEGNIDEMVKDQIVSGVKKAISRDSMKLVEDRTKEAVDDGVAAAVEMMSEKVGVFFEEWLDTEAVVTDRYGDPKEEGSLRDIIKNQFGRVMNEKVDREGKPSSYNGTMSRMEFLTGKKVRESVDQSLSRYGHEIDRRIKDAVNEGIKERVSNKFAEMVIGYAKEDYKNMKAIEAKGDK